MRMHRANMATRVHPRLVNMGVQKVDPVRALQLLYTLKSRGIRTKKHLVFTVFLHPRVEVINETVQLILQQRGHRANAQEISLLQVEFVQNVRDR